MQVGMVAEHRGLKSVQVRVLVGFFGDVGGPAQVRVQVALVP